MAIDSAAKRKSIAGIALLLVGVTADGSFGAEQRQAAAWSYVGIPPIVSTPAPADDDTDSTPTNYTDGDGATIRAPRLYLAHAANSLKRADRGTPLRVHADDHDRFHARHVLAGGTDREGRVHHVTAFTIRGGDVLDLRAIRFETDPVARNRSVRASDTTTGTDPDGAHVRPPVPLFSYSMDSTRRADQANPISGTADRFEGRISLVGQSIAQGRVMALSIETARGGEVLDLRRLSIEADPVPSGRSSRARVR